MASQIRYLDICYGMNQFSDAELEVNYFKLYDQAKQQGIVWVDFRYMNWFDIWALIQLLFILGDEEVKKNRRVINLLSPESIEHIDRNEEETYEQRKSLAEARLRFLSDMEFLQRASELGVELHLQKQINSREITLITPEQIKQLVAGDIDSEYITDATRPIIPITRLSSLNLKIERDQLYEKARSIFQEFSTESIVQEAGLGDCLLSELALNINHHAESDGYVALRAGKSLRHIKHNKQQFEKRTKARTYHLLKDWRTYYGKYPHDGFFEIIVADRGPGIAETISKDKRLSLEYQRSPTSINETHALLQYALQPESSRLTPAERKKKDLTDFTGLAAVKFVLSTHEGSLLIRERKSRHIFGAATSIAGESFEDIELKKGKTIEKIPFSTINGLSITAIIPIKRVHHTPPGVAVNHELLSAQPHGEALSSIKVFRVQPKTFSRADTFLSDKYKDWDWNSVAKYVKNDLDNYIKVILIDCYSASTNKNELWTGLVKVYKVCRKKALALVLCGVDQRLASRLEEYAALDEHRRISKGQDWLLLGFGDDRRIYCFGSTSNSHDKEHDFLAQQMAEALQKGYVISAELKNLIIDAYYYSSYKDSVEGDELPYLRLLLSSLRERLRIEYAHLLEDEIRDSGAWLENRKVLLNGGDVVADYLDIHSISQMREMFPDLSRLLRIISGPFDFDFVLSVGAASRTAAREISQYFSRAEERQGDRKTIKFYSYHDYFGFDHGEMGKQVIGENSKVLLLVDGVRKGEHVREVLEHVKDCQATVVAITAIFDLTDQNTSREIYEIPLRCALQMPVRKSKGARNKPTFVESPYTYNLIPLKGNNNTNEWTTILEKRLAYCYVEGNGLILTGHKTFFDQHFTRTISLPYLLNSSSAFKFEIVHRTKELIEKESVDCIVYPEQSSISALVEQVSGIYPSGRNVKSIMCRRVVWPDRASGYTLDILGFKFLSESQNILIIDDETYTGNSIKNLVSLCLLQQHNSKSPSDLFESSRELNKLIVLTIIDSMTRTERDTLTRLLNNSPGTNSQYRPEIKLFAFMQFSLCSYWVKGACPLCQRRDDFIEQATYGLGFIGQTFAENRIAELTPQSIDQDYSARKGLQRLPKQKHFHRANLKEPVTISSNEGLEIFCEEAYVEGELGWLVERIRPSDNEQFPIDVRLSIIELLSRDMTLLLRTREQQQLLENVRLLLNGRSIHAKQLARLMEILCSWPLYCLNHIWNDLWNAVLAENTHAFTESYPGAQLLLATINARPHHTLKKALLDRFDQKLYDLISNPIQGRTKKQDEESKRRIQLAMCLRRSVYRDRNIYTSLGALIAETALLVAYFSPNKPHHWTLRKGLDQLSNCSADMNASDCMYAVEMTSHLLYTLELLGKRDLSAAEKLKAHAQYDNLYNSIKKLQSEYPHHGPISSKRTEVQRYARSIRSILYPENSPPEDFKAALYDYLESYRRSLFEVLSRLKKWAIITSHVELNYLPENIDVELGDLFVVLNREAINEVFDDLVNNLGAAERTWRARYSPSDELFQSPLLFSVSVTVKKDIDFISVEIANECSAEDYSNIKNGAVGVGLGGLSLVLGPLGHSYTHSYNPERQSLKQVLSLRRIHR